ncbi:hypothetical protein FRC08_006476 [Ceratobasidium sp. 394]|nr:hypothetical protein FRC08_006476 [Ceratobasidium sp. 394]
MDPDHNLHTEHFVTDHEIDISPTYSFGFELPSVSDDATFSLSSDSHCTMSTLYSDEAVGYFRSLHGSTYVMDENVPITFPVDALRDRMDVVLHTIVRLTYDGQNVPDEVEAMLRVGGVNRGQGGARVLDVVTNSGTWVREMATPHEPHPRITFEVYNFHAGIRQSQSYFDLVHLRQGVLATKDFNFLLREAHRVLKPNGIVIITEFSARLYEADNPSAPLQSAPRRAEGIRLFRNALEFQGVDVTAWDDMTARLSPNHPLWPGNSYLSQVPKPGQDRPIPIQGFQSIIERQRLVPTGPWPSDQNQRIIGGLGRLLFGYTWKALLPLLLMMGIGETTAQALVDGILEEFVDDRFRAFLRCHMWSARKSQLR